MQLFLLLAIALVGGYLLAKSKLSKTIDGTANSAVKTSKDLAGKASNRLRGKSTPQGEIITTTEEQENKTNVSG